MLPAPPPKKKIKKLLCHNGVSEKRTELHEVDLTIKPGNT